VSDGDGTEPLGAGRRDAALAALAEARADDDRDDVPAFLQRLCRAAADTLGLAGAAVHLVNGIESGGVVAASDGWAWRVGDAAFSTGEGPSLEATSEARPVLVRDLLDDGGRRWPGYVTAVTPWGLRACFSLPLHLGAVRLGVLDLYARMPRTLTPEEVSMSLTFVDLALERLLHPEAGSMAVAVNARLAEALERRGEIHQAQGMVMVDLQVDLAEALSLMRAHAFARGLSLLDVAREIVAGGRLPAR
jgi:hypothetical protein